PITQHTVLTPHCSVLTDLPHAIDSSFFFFTSPATTDTYPLSLHDALPIYSRTSVFHPCLSAYFWYIWKRSPAKSCASSPPAAPRISIIIFLLSFSSLGINSIRNSSSISSFLSSNSSFSSSSNSVNSASDVSAIN